MANYVRLTRHAMRQLAPGKRIAERGIIFKRLANGDGVFSVNVMVDGQRIHRVVGRESDGTTRTQAEEFIQKVRQDAKNDRLALPKGRKVALSFQDAATKYLGRLEEEGGNDLRMKRNRLARHLIPFFGNLPLSKIGTSDIERYKHIRGKELSYRGGDRVSAEAKAKGAKVSAKAKVTSPGSINRELAVLSHLCSKAIEWDWIDRRPAKIKRLKEGSGRIEYLTSEEARRFVECSRGDENAHIYLFVVIALETSMRLKEILSMRCENVSLDRRVMFIPSAKGGAREQPITSHLAQVIGTRMEAQPKGSVWLFPSPRSKSGHTVDIRKPFRRVVSAAGLDLEKVVRHTLRHTAITHLVQAGVDLPTVKRISGHKTLAMVERYAHANGAHIQDAMDKLENRLQIAAQASQPDPSPVAITQELHKRGSGRKKTGVQPIDLLVGGARLELATNGLKVRCSTN